MLVKTPAGKLQGLANCWLEKSKTMSDQGLNNPRTQTTASLTHKIEQPNTNKCNIAVAADMLKTAEIRMQQKGMLPAADALCHNPFWFLVETEKNVFLWRSGHGLNEKQDFDFWVDVESLLDKRLKQLQRANYTDPSSAAFSEFDLKTDPIKAEAEYLIALRNSIGPILQHLSALSEVQAEIVKEALSNQSLRVVLPFDKKAAL